MEGEPAQPERSGWSGRELSNIDLVILKANVQCAGLKWEVKKKSINVERIMLFNLLGVSSMVRIQSSNETGASQTKT